MNCDYIETNCNCRLLGIKKLNENLFIGNKILPITFLFLIGCRRVLGIFRSVLIANKMPKTFLHVAI
jgi:hypothetical protein